MIKWKGTHIRGECLVGGWLPLEYKWYGKTPAEDADIYELFIGGKNLGFTADSEQSAREKLIACAKFRLGEAKKDLETPKQIHICKCGKVHNLPLVSHYCGNCGDDLINHEPHCRFWATLMPGDCSCRIGEWRKGKSTNART